MALALWIGGITLLCVAVAPAVHHSMASKPVAGEIVGKILDRLNRIEIGCWLTLLATGFSSFHFVSSKVSELSMLVLVIFTMGLLTLFYAFHLPSRMAALREKTPTLDTLSANHAAKIEFNRLHRIYVRLMSLNLVLGLGVLYGSVVILK